MFESSLFSELKCQKWIVIDEQVCWLSTASYLNERWGAFLEQAAEVTGHVWYCLSEIDISDNIIVAVPAYSSVVLVNWLIFDNQYFSSSGNSSIIKFIASNGKKVEISQRLGMKNRINTLTLKTFPTVGKQY